jgi:hypothetical protein
MLAAPAVNSGSRRSMMIGVTAATIVFISSDVAAFMVGGAEIGLIMPGSGYSTLPLHFDHGAAERVADEHVGLGVVVVVVVLVLGEMLASRQNGRVSMVLTCRRIPGGGRDRPR